MRGFGIIAANFSSSSLGSKRIAAAGAALTPHASDADWAVYRRQRESYEPFAADEHFDRIVVDTALSRDELLARLEARLRAL